MTTADKYWQALMLTMGQMGSCAGAEQLLPCIMLALPANGKAAKGVHVILAEGVSEADARMLLIDAATAIRLGRVETVEPVEGGG